MCFPEGELLTAAVACSQPQSIAVPQGYKDKEVCNPDPACLFYALAENSFFLQLFSSNSKAIK